MVRTLTLIALLAVPACGQRVPEWVATHQEAVLREFNELLAIPNIASDLPNIRRNADMLTRMMSKRGIQTRLLEMPNVPPVVYGELPTPGATRTLMFYAHYDGQPVNPSEWETGDPFRPIRKGDRLYARSASDDKGTIVAMLAALDALRESGVKLGFNLRFFFEGEEEAGSPHLDAIVRKHAAVLKADLWLICDGPVHQSGRQQIYFGARGIFSFDITVYGPIRELHSGHYGGWAPNPAVMLSHLVASMREENGRVKIPGFYESIEPLNDAEKQALARTPTVEQALKDELGLGRTEGDGRSLAEIINQPTLNIHGLRSADTGAQGRNVIPATATASIDIRLLKGLSPEKARGLVVEHIRRQGYFVTETEPDMAARRTHAKIARITGERGYGAAKTSMSLSLARQVISAIESVRGPVVLSPTLGGSVPLYIFERELGAPFLGLPIANYDNNQHAANENIRLENLWQGVETFAAVMTMASLR